MQQVNGRRRRFLFISNPVSGRARRALLRDVIAILRSRGCDVDHYETEAPGMAAWLVEAKVTPAHDALVVSGGDGTVGDVLPALIERRLPLGLIPSGTANVLAKEIGSRRRAEALANSLQEDPAQRISLGRARFEGRTRYFTLMAASGFDAELISHLSLSLKRAIGGAAYLWAAIGRLKAPRPQAISMRIDGKDCKAPWVIVCKAKRYAGDFIIAPQASLCSNSFQVYLFEKDRIVDYLRYGLAMVSGKLGKCGGVYVTHAERIELVGPKGAPFQLDGDLVGELPVELDVLSDAVSLITPLGRL